MRRVFFTVALLAALGAAARAGEAIARPFTGITHSVRTESSPRPVVMHIIVVDLSTSGLRFRLTARGRTRETIKRTTLQFLIEQKAQVAVNADFFEPWPPPADDAGFADLLGLAASDGDVYSGFDNGPPKPQAIRPDAPAINIGRDNTASIVRRNPADPGGRGVIEPVELWTAVSGNAQILTSGVVTTSDGSFDTTPNPRTVIALAPGRLVIFVADGRQPGKSEGLTTRLTSASFQQSASRYS